MIDCISVENMRQSDAYTIENFTPSLELMYRAAYGVFESVNWQGRIAIMAGSGNNGGDGYALACILKEHGFDCTVYSLGSRLSKDANHYADIAKGMNVQIIPFHSVGTLSGFDVVVDCLLGTGFQGSVRDDYRNAIEAINASGAYVVSVDINSGMNGDTGEAEIAVRSDITVTIGYFKTGLITERAGEYIKQLVCVDIGIVLFRKENLICSCDEWKDICQRSGIHSFRASVQNDGQTYFLAPDWLKL